MASKKQFLVYHVAQHLPTCDVADMEMVTIVLYYSNSLLMAMMMELDVLMLEVVAVPWEYYHYCHQN